MAEILTDQNNMSNDAQNGSKSIRDLCSDLLGKAREYTKAFDFRIKPKTGAAEFWLQYRKRLATYDRDFNYPGSVNPIKCAVKGWTYVDEGKLQCVECNKMLHLSISNEANVEETEQTALNTLKNLRNGHDSLCSFYAAFHHSLILHSVAELTASIKANVQEQLYKSEEIANEFASLTHVAAITPSFALYFAIAGWFVKKDKTLLCKLCLQTVDPANHKDSVMDPLKLHYDYCSLLESYPQWKLALEEYVYANCNPSSVSENFALIQRQLAITGLSAKIPTCEIQDLDEEMPSVNEGTDAATVDVNRTLESLHEAHNQSADTQELPQLRDTDFEAQIQQDSLSRKRQREEISEQEAPLAKRSYLPFPHNYLAEYNQPTENVVPISIDNQSTNDESLDPIQIDAIDDIVQSPVSVQESNNSLLSPVNNDNEIGEEDDENEILAEHELDRMPIHDGGERDSEDSGDTQSAAEAESYNDDDASTNSEVVNENAPYDEPEEFENQPADNNIVEEGAEDSFYEDYDNPEDMEELEDYEEDSGNEADQEQHPPPENASDSDSDIICLDDDN